jgi:hypothetical protein
LQHPGSGACFEHHNLSLESADPVSPSRVLGGLLGVQRAWHAQEAQQHCRSYHRQAPEKGKTIVYSLSVNGVTSPPTNLNIR